ncbi:MAG TPA: ribonuclease P protein component [Dehalococcoidia bacterium]|nr:ribonuclease P protein component [Dehalococcoidia bacterium]
MRREQRLRRREDFAAVYERGRRYTGDLLAIRVLPNGLDVTRFGIATGRAIGGAVVRNRVKRRVREGLRTLPVAPGWDIVVNVRRPAVEADYWRLRDAAAKLLARAGLLQAEPEKEKA